MKKDFVYLASASPRRRELLCQIGVRFELAPADVDETHVPGETPAEYVVRMALAKAQAAARQRADDHPVLAADTTVVLDGHVLGKPENSQAAERMLAALSGRTHRVFTAVAVCAGDESATRVSASDVRLRATTLAERRAYCATGEPFDKAGGYGIQGLAAIFVEHLAGSYSGVMGLPLCETAELLERFGVPTGLDPESAA